ncbi:GNAT family N-acetyltransferase [Neobacillus sp. M.A.Huq-85]
MENIENAISFNKLKWDTDFFGVTSARAILHRAISFTEWNELKTRFSDFQFLSIVNQNSEPVNAQLIGKETSAFLADVNIQFVKEIEDINEMPKNITVHQSLKRNNQVIDLTNFSVSKFIEDEELSKRGGKQVYRQWVMNSFGKPDKFFALSLDENGEINGFLLHSYSGNTCVIELIAVSTSVTKRGVGSRLFKAVEFTAHLKGINEIKVGTQMRNIDAINFYHRVGCKQTECHQVYHLWNK